VFGDVAQNVTPWRGVKNWEDAFVGFDFHFLNQNYRNTNQIVAFVANKLGLDMQSIGYDGPQVCEILPRGINAFFKEKKGLKAVICTEETKEEFMRKAYNDVGAKNKVSRSKINIMTVYESKGLEFTSVVVVEKGMSESERYIAYTRALNELAFIKE
jgi:DNA helicase IV